VYSDSVKSAVVQEKVLMTVNIRVWDVPTRLFHWLLVFNFVALIVSGQLGGAAMVWHFRFGYTVLALLLFRLIWGFAGGYWSRFSTFIPKPSQLLSYLKEQTNSVGHNPLGALSVLAMLLFLFLQVFTGLLSDDEIAATGPLTRFASNLIVGNATFYHKELGKIALLLLVSTHLGAIGFYFFRKHENLVRAMITGDKVVEHETQSSQDSWSDRTKALLIFAMCLASVFGTVYWLG
jgi:cytochrome b